MQFEEVTMSTHMPARTSCSSTKAGWVGADDGSSVDVVDIANFLSRLSCLKI